MRVRICMMLLALVGAAGLWAGCDSAPGAAEERGLPPQLSDFSYSPPAFSLAEADTSSAVVQLPISMAVTARDADDRVTEVVWVLQSPLYGSRAVEAGRLQFQGDARYSAEAVIEIPRGEIGKYTVLVYALDEAGLKSNEMRGLINFIGSGRPPVIEKVEADPPVVRPPVTLFLIATVSDPDGLSNVGRVVGQTPNGFTFEMFDDGESKGDEEAGDGRYTASFEVPNATPGTQTFTFQAFDRSGLSSEIFSFDVTIE